MKYDKGDSYYYSGTSVLINIPEITDQDELDIFEQEFSAIRMLDVPEGDFGMEHLQAIHKHIFQDTYHWAGEFRNCTLSKGDSLFAQPQDIPSQATRICSEIQLELQKGVASQECAVSTIAHVIAELNALHPFREGNGRVIRELARQLAEKLGYYFNVARIYPQQWLAASIASHRGDETKLREIMENTLEKM